MLNYQRVLGFLPVAPIPTSCLAECTAQDPPSRRPPSARPAAINSEVAGLSGKPQKNRLDLCILYREMVPYIKKLTMFFSCLPEKAMDQGLECVLAVTAVPEELGRSLAVASSIHPPTSKPHHAAAGRWI